MVRKSVFLLTLALFLFNQSFVLAAEGELSRFTNSDKPIKVFLGNFVNESGKNQIVPNDFKKELEKALLNRKVVKFEVVEAADKSDLQVSGVIQQYQYLEKDPVTVSPSPAGMLLDAATTENYVDMKALFTVVETKTGKTLWKESVTAYLKHMMTPEQSIPMIYDKISRDFLWKSFGKPDRV